MLRYLLLLFVFASGIASASTPKSGFSTPAAFVENVGQVAYTDGVPATGVIATVKFGGVAGFVSPTGIMMVYSKQHVSRDDYAVLDVQHDLLRVDRNYLNGNPNARVEWLDVQEGTQRYINGATGLKGAEANRYNGVILHEVWKGIDVRLQVSARGIKEDFIVHAGADASQIAVKYVGAEGVSVSEQHNVSMTTAFGGFTESAPISYTTGPKREDRAAVSVIPVVSGTTVRFNIAEYNTALDLVIDPDQVWATYFGYETDMFDLRIVADKWGNVISSGSTAATNLPRITGVVQNRHKALVDGYIVKFNDQGTFIWSTYYGGSLGDQLLAIDVDSAGNIWTCGSTSSRDLPQAWDVGGAILGSGPLGDPDSVEATDALILALKPDGSWHDSWLVYGLRQDVARSIAVRDGAIVTVGQSNSSKLGSQFGDPYTHHPENSFDNIDVWVHQVVPRDATSDRWKNNWLSFYGDRRNDVASSVRYDADGGILISGYTYSPAFPVTDGTVHSGQGDAFLLKFNSANPGQRVFATLFGTPEVDEPNDMDIDSEGNVVCVGKTTSATWPLINAYRNNLGGLIDGWARKMNGASGVGIFSTYVGGDSIDIAYSVAIDASNRIWIGGSTNGPDLPTTPDAHQPDQNGNPPYANTEGYMLQFSPDGQTVIYGTYLGAPAQDDLPDPPQPPVPPNPPAPGPGPEVDFGQDNVQDIAVDKNAYVFTATSALTLRMPTTEGAFQDSSVLDHDTIRTSAFFSYFSDCPDSVVVINSIGPPSICDNNAVTLAASMNYAAYLWNTGDTTRTIVVADTGDYIVTCVTDQGCRFRDTITVTRNPKPFVSAGNDTIGCLNQLIQLTATPSAGTPPYTYKWKRLVSGPSFIDDDTIRQPSVNPDATSKFEIVVTDSAGCEAFDTVEVVVVNPQPTFAPSPVDFGELDACESSRDETFMIYNNESYSVTVVGSTPDGNQIELVTNVTTPLTIAAGDSLELTLRGAPIAVGTTNGEIKISGQPCNWEISVPYTMERASLLATVTPSVINFPSGVSCDVVSRDSSVVIRNGGTDPLVLKPGMVAAPFTIVSPVVETTIEAGTTLRVDVRFNPVVDGTWNEIAAWPYTSGSCSDTIRVTLRGSRASVDVSASPTMIDYGTLEGCDDERDTIVTIRNASGVAVTVTLPTTAEVVFEPAGPIVVPAGDSAQITVTIRPAAAGNFTANPKITIQPCDEEITLALSAVKNGIAFTTPASVNLGKINSCIDPATTTSSFQISFDGTGSATVTDVQIGSNLTTTLTSGVSLDAGVAQTFDVTWTPTQDGLLIDSLVVTFNPCDVRRVIRLTGSRVTPSLVALDANINLGATAAPSTGMIRFENDGTDTIFVGATASVNASVTGQTPDALTPVLPGQVIVVDWRVPCIPVINDTIFVTSLDQCQTSAFVTITGTCDNSGPDARALVRIDSAGVKVGQRFNLPIILQESTNLDGAGYFDWEAEVTFNPMVVVGSGSTPDCFVENQYSPCTITVRGTRPSQQQTGTLANLDFTAILGNAAETGVALTAFTWLEDTDFVTEMIDGHVLITDICEEGGIRLLDPKSEAFSIRVYPTPATTVLTIDIRGLGSQPGTWTLSNYVGQQIGSGTLTPDSNGNVVETIDVSAQASGTYFLTIDARGTVYRTPVLIQR